MPKVKFTLTVSKTYELDPTAYCNEDGSQMTLEEALALDKEAIAGDPFVFIDDPNVNVWVAAEVLEETNG